MRLDLAAYLLIGATMGLLWNRAELGRAPVRRLVPSFCVFLAAWPVLAIGMIVIAGIWTRIWRKTHEADHPPAPKLRPEAPAFTGNSPEPHPL
ncbi:MAG: hypothetical protein ACREFQ_00465 [Stellaceae bacterium]